jgi:endoplasmic reticulum-Golgi intermediate compartment protein 2
MMTISEDDEDGPPNPLKAFDAFPKVHQSYVQSQSSRGGLVSFFLLCIVTVLFWTEIVLWWSGTEEMRVAVEKGVGHGMQLNVDITVAMRCEGTGCVMDPEADHHVDVEVNVLDATGDRIFAGQELTQETVDPPREPPSFRSALPR